MHLFQSLFPFRKTRMNPYYVPHIPTSAAQNSSLDNILSKMADASNSVSATPTAIAEAVDSWNQNHFQQNNTHDEATGRFPFPTHSLPQNATTLPNASSFSTAALPIVPVEKEYVRHLWDDSVVCDRQGRPVTVGRMLATKPLASDLQTRPGPGGKKLVYLSGDTVTRLLNEIFGFSGWNLQILKTDQVLCVNTKAAPPTEPPKSNTSTTSSHAASTAHSPKPPSSNSIAPLWHVAYLSHVRITLARSGSYREDLGAGDAMDRNLGTAIQHAIKASITDAMKRAARHLGDKLGNSLYQGTFRIANAPKTLLDALDATVPPASKSIPTAAAMPSVTLCPSHKTIGSMTTTTAAAAAPPSKINPPPKHIPQPPPPIHPPPKLAENSSAPPCHCSTNPPQPQLSSIVKNETNREERKAHNNKNAKPLAVHAWNEHSLEVYGAGNVPSLGVRPSVPPLTAAEGLHQAMLLYPPAAHSTEVTISRPRTSSGRRKSSTPAVPSLVDDTTTKEVAPLAKKSKMNNPYSMT